MSFSFSFADVDLVDVCSANIEMSNAVIQIIEDDNDYTGYLTEDEVVEVRQFIAHQTKTDSRTSIKAISILEACRTGQIFKKRHSKFIK